MAHLFTCKAKSGQLVPTSLAKEQLLKKLLDHYERVGTTFTIKIEEELPNINGQQEKLYKAFVLKAASHFGSNFGDMQKTLYPFFPTDEFGEKIMPQRWSTPQLNTFIDQASAKLVEFGFHF